MLESEKEVVEVGISETSLGGERGREVNVAAVKAVIGPMLAAHGAVSSLSILIRLALALLFFARNCATGDAGVNLVNFVEAFGERELNWPTDLTVKTSFERPFRGNDCAKRPNIEE